jgi:hypothetical protein
MSDDMLLFDALDEGVVTEVIRPAAIMPEQAARSVLVELAVRDVRSGGTWHTTPTLWRRFDRPWSSPEAPGASQLLGSLQVAYGTPTKYEITIYRATITQQGLDHGFDVVALTDEALGFGGLNLATCPRAQLAPPPQRFRMR